MINAHESGSNSPGAGTFSRDLTKTKSLQCRDFTWALHMEKNQYPRYSPALGQMTGTELNRPNYRCFITGVNPRINHQFKQNK